VPFFEKLENAMMEIRTKSNNIKPLFNLWFIPKNTEIAFSLNPQILINKYEKWSASLDDRIKAINELLNLWFKVGLRFIPLLPVKDYEKIYSEFVWYIKQNIDLQRIYSIFIWWLLYTKKDYNKILSKFSNLDILHMLELWDDDFYRENRGMRETFYKMFMKLDNRCKLCFEKI
jgi:spore photoproduct lyase